MVPQLHRNGEVRQVMRKQVPPELQEAVRLACIQQYVPGSDENELLLIDFLFIIINSINYKNENLNYRCRDSEGGADP